MLTIKYVLFGFLFTLNHCFCEKSPTYKAAVVEVHPTKMKEKVKNQLIDIIKSPGLKNVDIVVLPEAILNSVNSSILMPNSTVFCDDPNAHPIFHDISCAARAAKMYVVIAVYTKIYCSMDDQSFCSNKTDNTNAYNMAFVFDRTGATVAKYRKFHLWAEHVQTPKTPDLITFQTDFNVTFGVFICFDLLFDSPPVQLVDRGVHHFVFPTKWPLQLPFMNANQFQQSWAYGNDVVLLAANANTNTEIASDNSTSGSGIYAGHSAALGVFYSATPATTILIADIPINMPQLIDQSNVEKIVFAKNTAAMGELATEVESNKSAIYDDNIDQEDLRLFTINFLDFSRHLGFNGTVCNGDICCNYDIDADDNGSNNEKPSYFYAVMAFNGYRAYGPIPNLLTHQSACGLIACGEMNNRSSCAKRFTSNVHYRYNFKKLSFIMETPTSRAKNIMPSTVSHDLLPLNAKEFKLKTSKLNDVQKYAATLNLRLPKSDLLTFSIFSRHHQKDQLTS